MPVCSCRAQVRVAGGGAARGAAERGGAARGPGDLGHGVNRQPHRRHRPGAPRTPLAPHLARVLSRDKYKYKDDSLDATPAVISVSWLVIRPG